MKDDLQRITDAYFSLLDKNYPQFAETTHKNTEIVVKMIDADYSDFSSDEKRLRFVKRCLNEMIENSFVGEVVKKYMLTVVDFFFLPEMRCFFESVLNTSATDFEECLKGLRGRVNCWQGYEGYPERHLAHLLLSQI